MTDKAPRLPWHCVPWHCVPRLQGGPNVSLAAGEAVDTTTGTPSLTWVSRLRRPGTCPPSSGVYRTEFCGRVAQVVAGRGRAACDGRRLRRWSLGRGLRL
ncbi:hypothetical protein GCM10027200_01520 [Lentzea nigeriaca]